MVNRTLSILKLPPLKGEADEDSLMPNISNALSFHCVTLAKVKRWTLVMIILFRDNPPLRAEYFLDTPFEGKAISEVNRLELIAFLARRLLRINPTCTLALRYLTRVLERDIPIEQQDLEYTLFKDLDKDQIPRDALIVELCRSIRKIEPNNRFATIRMAQVAFSKIPIKKEDLIGTELENENPIHYSNIDLSAALSRQLIQCAIKEGHDLISDSAYAHLGLCLAFKAKLKAQDLLHTPFENNTLDSVNRAALIEYYSQFNSHSASIANAIKLNATIKKQKNSFENPYSPSDLMRLSISECRPEMLERITGAFDSRIQSYLALECIHQEQYMSMSATLFNAAFKLNEEEKVIQPNLLLGSAWEGHNPQSVPRYDFIAELCRKALSFDPKNAEALCLLGLSLSKGASLKKVDLKATPFAECPLEAVDRQRLVNLMYIKASLLSPYDEQELEELKKDPSVELIAIKLETPNPLAAYSSARNSQYSYPRLIQEERIEPEEECIARAKARLCKV